MSVSYWMQDFQIFFSHSVDCLSALILNAVRSHLSVFFFFFVYANGVLPEIIYQANVLDSTSNVPQYFLLGIFQFQVLHVNLSSTLMVIFITIILSHEVR